MEDGRTLASATGKECGIPPLSSYKVIYPTNTSIYLKNFKYAVDFHPKERSSCKNTWYRDLKSTHIRNWRLLDFPYKKAKCCSDIYNVVLDRQKLKKLQKYGLTREVRTITSELEPEEIKKCVPEEDIEVKNVTYFPECYEVPEFDSSSDEEDEYELCTSGSVTICSGCSTLGGELKNKMHKVIKKDLKVLLHSNEEICIEKVKAEIRKHKLGRDFPLKLQKFF